MTTAARPTFEPAKGGTGRGERDLSALSKQYSARDLASHTRLKYREHGQTSSEEVRSRDFRKELEDKERAVQEKRSGGRPSRESTKKPRLDQITPANLDADDAQDEIDDASDSDSDSEDESELYAELERIRRERIEENARIQKERAEQEERIRMENIISGNPLLSIGTNKSDMKVKRRWDDDVVFKNCASAEEKKTENAFINDSLRSEFHKRFMEKYIK